MHKSDIFQRFPLLIISVASEGYLCLEKRMSILRNSFQTVTIAYTGIGLNVMGDGMRSSTPDLISIGRLAAVGYLITTCEESLFE